MCNLPNCSLKKLVGPLGRSEPGAFVPSSVSVSKGLNCPMKVEKTFLLERFLKCFLSSAIDLMEPN